MDQPDIDDPAAERRASKRRDTASADTDAAVYLVDLSPHGCCLGFRTAIEYRPGQFIRLSFNGESEAIRAIVRWTNGERIGMEFTSDLGDARIEAILSQGHAPQVGLL